MSNLLNLKAGVKSTYWQETRLLLVMRCGGERSGMGERIVKKKEKAVSVVARLKQSTTSQVSIQKGQSYT